MTTEGRGGARGAREDLFRMPISAFVRVVGLGLLQAAALIAFIVVLMQVTAAFVVRGVGAAGEQEYQRALAEVGVLAVLGLLLGVLRAAEFTVAETAGYRVVQRLRMEMYLHLQRMLPAHLHHRARGGLLLRLTGDLSMLRMWLSRGLLEGTSAAIVVSGGLLLLGWVSPNMALATIVVLALGSALSLTNGRAMRAATRRMRRRRSLLIGNIDEQMGAMSVVQVAGRLTGEAARLSRQNEALTRSLVRVARLRGRLRGISTATGLLATVAVVTVGLTEARTTGLAVDRIIAGVVIVRFLTRPVRTLGLVHDYWQRGVVSREKVAEFLASRARSVQEEELEPLRVRRGRIELQAVTVPGALEAVTAVVEPRRIIAVTGPSGSGKSTLLKVIARQVEPASGTVLIDDQVLARTAPSSIARQVGISSPDLPLLRGSARRNLTYAASWASPEEVQRVAFSLGIDRALRAHGEDGVATWILESGRNLSVGQRQLVALGRALVGNPMVLLLDEPLTGLDDEHRALAREQIIRHRGTVLWVTRDPEEIELADEVWVLAEGRLLEVIDGPEFRDRRWLSRQGGVSWRPHAS